jgi:glutathione S-transferase
VFRDKLAQRFQWIDAQLADKPYLMGDSFSVADAYLFTVSGWSVPMKIDLPANLRAYRERMLARPAVQEAMKAEGLLK